mmetsp:Transcript_7631/g.14971  ORF Transcript_7631/g.14971 Transcript_7631/m.14971 type:complete len:312 (+) Transcript_7631:852-1787(+)
MRHANLRVDPGQEPGKKPRTTHGDEDAGLTHQATELGLEATQDRRHRDNTGGPRHAVVFEDVGESGVGKAIVRVFDHAHNDCGHADIDGGGNAEGAHDGDGKVAVRVTGLFRHGSNHIESDKTEKNVGGSGEHAGSTVGSVGLVVGAIHFGGAGDDNEENGDQVNGHGAVLDNGRLPATEKHDNREERDHEDAEPFDRKVAVRVDLEDAETNVEEGAEVRRKPFGYSSISQGPLNEQLASRQPANELTKGESNIVKSTTSHGKLAGVFSITKSRQYTSETSHDKAHSDGGAKGKGRGYKCKIIYFYIYKYL